MRRRNGMVANIIMLQLKRIEWISWIMLHLEKRRMNNFILSFL